VRKYVYRDADNLDTAFDAGGKVSIGLTATTIVSQWTWSATLLQSSTVASKVRKRKNYTFWGIEFYGMLHYVILGLVDRGQRLRADPTRTVIDFRHFFGFLRKD